MGFTDARAHKSEGMKNESGAKTKEVKREKKRKESGGGGGGGGEAAILRIHYPPLLGRWLPQ